MSKVISGGVKRKIVMPCGKIICAGFRDANQYMKLHEIYCDLCKNSKLEKIHMSMGMNGVEYTKNGNIVHHQLYTNDFGCYKKM